MSQQLVLITTGGQVVLRIADSELESTYGDMERLMDQIVRKVANPLIRIGTGQVLSKDLLGYFFTKDEPVDPIYRRYIQAVAELAENQVKDLNRENRWRSSLEDDE